MALIRSVIFVLACLFTNAGIRAQPIYYPAGASQLLQSTAADLALLLNKAMPSRQFITEPYQTIPTSGILLIYDETIINNQVCKVTGNGQNLLRFSAAEDNGLNYGIYQYLQLCGFKFYQPGTLWEEIPSLTTAFRSIDTLLSCPFQYKTWFISGGSRSWAMDRNDSYYWENYGGENGHQWSLYQRRNNMTGGSRFAGHRDDIMTAAYLAVLRNNPCYVAPVDGSRIPSRNSVADINNGASMELWSNAIEQQYQQFKQTIFGNQVVFANQYRNFNYQYGRIGIEVPDGATWANSKDNLCAGNGYAKESDQHFTLANFTVASISKVQPGKRFQLYAYNEHADIPSSRIKIDPKIDIQVVPTAFQNETSPKALLSRWYQRTGNISEYHYLNLPLWSGETPSFYLNDLKLTVQRLREQGAQGIVWEASPAKFASLPFLLAANAALKDGTPIDSTLEKFCRNMFGPASKTIYTLLQYWSNENTVTVYNGLQDNKYKLSLYLQLVAQASKEASLAPSIIRQRLNELKAYLHYMVLYYDWIFDQRPATEKSEKAAVLCLYLAKIHRMQIVNSYFLINTIVNKYPATHFIHTAFNTQTGTAYQNGQLALLTEAEIAAGFQADLLAKKAQISQYVLPDATAIINEFDKNELEPLDKISVKLHYSNGKNYNLRTEFNIIAQGPGSITIRYTPHFEIPAKGYINFTVEDIDQTLGIIKDVSINTQSGQGLLYIALPAAGNYKLSVVGKYKSAVDLLITTNGNYFYKSGPFLGNGTENYRGNLLSLPGYFYIPKGLDRLYFSSNNSNPGGKGFMKPADYSRTFAFTDHQNRRAEAQVENNGDSALYYFELPPGSGGTFWKALKMENNRLCFANTTNLLWYARKKICTAANFKAVIEKDCTTTLNATVTGVTNSWTIYDASQWYEYHNTSEMKLPETISPNAIIAFTSNNCTVIRRPGDDADYLREKLSCTSGAPVAAPGIKVVVYPNPGTGLYKVIQNGEPVLAEEIVLLNSTGARVITSLNTQQFNIGHLPAGVYWYTINIKGVFYRGKLVKL